MRHFFAAQPNISTPKALPNIFTDLIQKPRFKRKA